MQSEHLGGIAGNGPPLPKLYDQDSNLLRLTEYPWTGGVTSLIPWFSRAFPDVPARPRDKNATQIQSERSPTLLHNLQKKASMLEAN